MKSEIKSFFNTETIVSPDGVIYLSNPEKFRVWQHLYLAVRKSEGRWYPDEIVQRLPEIYPHHPLSAEWQIRARTAQRFISYLQKKTPLSTILDLGCGNGWLANQLAQNFDCQVFAMDINDYELSQGARLFAHRPNLMFLFGDVDEDVLPVNGFDIIFMASSVQYFPNLKRLFQRLQTLLNNQGEIHLMDSPFYLPRQLKQARRRTRKYYQKLGIPQMTTYYYHHSLAELKPFRPVLLYRPGGIVNRVRRKILRHTTSPFPWIRISSPQ